MFMQPRVWLLLAVFVFALSNAVQAAESDPPNIVYILADDLGYAELGCYGQQHIRTPNIDHLAREGIRFTQHYSGNAVCAPSRCCLLTGKHPGHAHVRNNRNPQHLQHLKDQFGWEFPGQYPIPYAEVTIAEMLRPLGYATGAMGKWGLGHFGTTGDPNRQGFDLFYGFNCQVHAHNHFPRFLWRNSRKEVLPGNDRTLNGETYSQDNFIGVAKEFIRANKYRPFFLYLPVAIPHLSIQVPEKTLTEYRDKIPEERYEHKGYLEHPHPRAGYAAMVTHLDRGVGEIVHLLEELNLTDRTLVVFSSDNGPTFDRLGGSDSDFFKSAGGFRGLKGSLYEGGIRIPLVAKWPGRIKPGTASDHVSAFWDVMPTIGEVCGATVPADIDGVSFAPTLLGRAEEQKEHEYLYWEFSAYGGQQAVRMGNWKGIRQKMLDRRNEDPLKIELYDLAQDSSEASDVSDLHPAVVKRVRDIMRTARVPSELFPFGPID
jgi:arylsulfatase A